MRFSVLLSLYHKESPYFLRQSLDSVFSQTLPPDEVVLVEDGPLTMELHAVVNEYKAKHKEMKVVWIEKNGGLGNALNEGLRHCSHDLVARMDTDDVSKPYRFEKQVAYMEAYPDVAVVGAWIDEFVETTDDVKSTRKLPQEHEAIYKFGKKRNPINHPVVMFRKRAVEAVGSYQPMPLFEDYYLWAKMLCGGFKFHNIPEALLFFRISPAMYRRRGGVKYALKEIRFQMEMMQLGYINFGNMCRNVGMRFCARVLPYRTRSWVYKNFLRK